MFIIASLRSAKGRTEAARPRRRGGMAATVVAARVSERTPPLRDQRFLLRPTGGLPQTGRPFSGIQFDAGVDT